MDLKQYSLAQVAINLVPGISEIVKARQPVTEDAYKQIEATFRFPVASLKALEAVESSGKAFFPNGAPTINYEGHIFHKYTKGIFSSAYPRISYPSWDPTNYSKNYIITATKFHTASNLDLNAAYFATSWGKFQIMGFNFPACGCKSLEIFIDNMWRDEASQLLLLANYLMSVRLQEAMLNGDWKKVARVYNGPGYWRNQYDEKLKAAHERYLAKSV